MECTKYIIGVGKYTIQCISRVDVGRTRQVGRVGRVERIAGRVARRWSERSGVGRSDGSVTDVLAGPVARARGAWLKAGLGAGRNPGSRSRGHRGGGERVVQLGITRIGATVVRVVVG